MTDRDELDYFINRAKGAGYAVCVRHTPEGYVESVQWGGDGVGAGVRWCDPLSFAEKARVMFGAFRR